MSPERLRAVADASPPEPHHGAPGESTLTIEQLAAESGMSVRNIRAHQARGLLGPPDVRHRIGYYGRDHLTRLRLIQELQADGFNLRGIERLLENSGGEASEAMLSFRRAVTAPFESERPEIVSLEELRERFGDDISAGNLERALKLGVLAPVGPTSYEAPSPSLLRIAEEVIDRGVPLEAALDVVEVMQRSSGYVAKAFAQLFVRWIWQPFEQEGRPAKRWDEVLESIERLRPIASESLVSVFQMTMSAEVDKEFGRELGRLAGESRHERRRRRG